MSSEAPFMAASARFAHAVNTPELLEQALRDAEAGRINFIECDIIIGIDGVKAVMGHDAGHFTRDDGGEIFTFESFVSILEKRGQSKLGLKVDIKSREATGGVLAVLKRLEKARIDDGLPSAWPLLTLQSVGKASFAVPALMINADVLTGPRSDPSLGCRFNSKKAVLPVEEQIEEAKRFIEEVGASLPSAILSLGWTTAPGGAKTSSLGRPVFDDRGNEFKGRTATSTAGFVSYTASMVDAMISVTAPYPGVHFTWPVKAAYVPYSWPNLQRLMGLHPSSTLTLWSHEPATAAQQAWFEAFLPKDRTMYDLPTSSTSTSLLGGCQHSSLFWAAIGGAIAAVGALFAVTALKGKRS
jgi:Uncharacterized conserved protein (DUF2181)